MPFDGGTNHDDRGKILIGTCGFAESHRKLFGEFDILEVQQTFYQPPRLSTAERWREEAPAEFVFTLKCLVPYQYIARSRERLFLARELIDLFLEDLKE